MGKHSDFIKLDSSKNVIYKLYGFKADLSDLQYIFNMPV